MSRCPAERAELLSDLVGARANRRHRPGRGFEALRYRFEIVADYGAFRDLQRHRMLTVQWQPLTPDLGADVPEQVELAGVGDRYRRALERSRVEYERLHAAGLASAAPYALCLGYRLRFILDLNAREAMQLIELRSGREGHPSYRAVAHEMHARIAAVHPAVAAAMTHVDTETEPRLERILSEMRTQARAPPADLPEHARRSRSSYVCRLMPGDAQAGAFVRCRGPRRRGLLRCDTDRVRDRVRARHGLRGVAAHGSRAGAGLDRRTADAARRVPRRADR